MNRPWMPLYVGDYVADTAHLTAAESGAYLHLLMHYWMKGGLPTDDRMLSRVARLSPEEWDESRSIIQAFFQEGWKHKRVEFELTEAARISAAATKGGVASAAARRAKKQAPPTNDGSTTVERPFNDPTNDVGNDLATIGQPLHSQRVRVSLLEEQKLLSYSVGSLLESRGTSLARAGSNGHANPPDDWPPAYAIAFWAKYPNKVGKRKALAKLDAVRRRGVSWMELWAGLERYCAKTDDRAWCNPETWLNGDRWTDEPAAVSRGPPPSQQPPRPGSREDRAERTHHAKQALRDFANGHDANDPPAGSEPCGSTLGGLPGVKPA